MLNKAKIGRSGPPVKVFPESETGRSLYPPYAKAIKEMRNVVRPRTAPSANSTLISVGAHSIRQRKYKKDIKIHDKRVRVGILI